MPAEKKSFTATEIKAGLFVLLSLAVLAGFIGVVMRVNLAPPPMKAYHTYLTSTLGLNNNALVRFGGVQAGMVTNIGYVAEEDAPDAEGALDPPRAIRVDFEVFEPVPVNADCIASVEQVTFTSERHLELTPGTYSGEILASGSTVNGRSQAYGFIQMPDTEGALLQVEKLLEDIRRLIGVNEAEKPDAEGNVLASEDFQITRIAATVKTLLENLDTFLGVQEALEQEAATGEEFVRVSAITSEVKELLAYLQGPIFEEGNIGTLLEEAANAASQVNALLDENRPVITGAIKSIESAAGGVSEVIAELTPRIDAIADALQGTLENAQGLTANAAHFLEENRPAIEDLIDDLRESVRNLREFSRTLAEQPEAVIRGQSPRGRQD
jgi:ABC-type transporter Mla subunit MlaD